jgi:hypothetical protein
MPVQTNRFRPRVEALDERCLLAASLTASLHPISATPAEIVVTKTTEAAPMDQFTLNFAAVQGRSITQKGRENVSSTAAPMDQFTLNFAAVSGGHTDTTALDHVLTQLSPTGDVRLRRIVQGAAPSSKGEQPVTETGPVQVNAKVHTWPGTIDAAVSNIMKTKHDT